MNAKGVSDALILAAEKIESVALGQREGGLTLPGALITLDTVSSGLRSTAQDWQDLSSSQPHSVAAGLSGIRSLLDLIRFLERQFGDATSELGAAADMLQRVLDSFGQSPE